jgi:hypothetical protein
MLLVVALATTGVVFAVRGLMQEHASGGRSSVTDRRLTAADRKALGLSTEAEFLWDEPAGLAVATLLTEQSDTPMAEVYELDLYSDYAFVTGRDAVDGAVAVHAEWRRGVVTAAQTRLRGPGQSLPSFRLDEVPWSRLSDLMDEAVQRLDVQGADVRYLQIDAGLYGRDELTLRVYVSGPGGAGGLVEADRTGTIVRVLPGGMGPRNVQ